MQNKFSPDRLRKARENLGITKAEAARRLNLSNIGYCRYEYGDRTPSAQTTEVIARCFGVSSDYLYGRTDDRAPDYVIIYEKDNKPLFDLVIECSSIRENEPKISQSMEAQQTILADDLARMDWNSNMKFAHNEGKAEGKVEESAEIINLNRWLISEGRQEDIIRYTEDPSLLPGFKSEFHASEQK